MGSVTKDQWTQEQDFEAHWWGDCRSTFAEEAKQLTYARKMGLWPINDGGRWPLYELPQIQILDVGGGPVSMLLKVHELEPGCTVVDPCDYPEWTRTRYRKAGIQVIRQPAEEFSTAHIFDEAWCYNVLQHTQDPEAIVDMMRRQARLVRIFEWVGFPPSPGHPHELSAGELNRWLGPGEGWTNVSRIMWDLNVDDKPVYGGQAFHGYRVTDL